MMTSTGQNTILMISNMTIFSEISRIEGAEFKAEVDEIVWLLTHGSNLVPIKSEDVMYLYDVSFIEKRRFTSLMGGYARMGSIIQEINRCDPNDKDTFDHALILIQTSKKQPLTMSELQMLNDITKGLPPEVLIHWGIGTNEYLKDKVFMMIVYSKKQL